jgi:hypothetical protein
MDEQEKLAQLEAGRGVQAPEPDDMEILFPKPLQWDLGDRSYTLRPLRFYEIDLMFEIQSINIDAITKADTERIIELVSSILNEPDKNFIRRNLDPVELKDLIDTTKNINYKGIPVNKKKAMVKKGLSEKV